MGRKEHRSGFSAIAGLLVVLAIVVISGAGWLVYQHNRVKVSNAAADSPQSTTQQPTTTTTTQPAQSTTPYLDIKEWGVSLTLNSDTASLYYYINPQLPNVAYLSLKSISDVAPTCAANNGPLGAISRLSPAEHQSALNGSIHSIPGTKQIGNYWYGYEGSHADCTDGTAAMQSAVSKAAPNFNASTLINTFNTLAATSSAN